MPAAYMLSACDAVLRCMVFRSLKLHLQLIKPYTVPSVRNLGAASVKLKYLSMQSLNRNEISVFFQLFEPENYGHTANTHVLEVQGLGTLRGSQAQALQGLAGVDH